ncbi:hypothetical protein AB1E18_009428 [Capra hircus]
MPRSSFTTEDCDVPCRENTYIRRNNGIPVPSPGLNKLLLAVCTCIITWSGMSLGQPAGSRKRVINTWNTAEAPQLSPAPIGQHTANPQDILRRIIQRCFYPPPHVPCVGRPRGAGRGSGSVCGFWERPPEWMEGTLNRAMEESSEPQLDAKSKLIDFQWKLGMAVSSDSCRSLKYPYVAVMLKVADHSGQVKNKSFEMTIPQFQNFYRQFKEIAAIIETV